MTYTFTSSQSTDTYSSLPGSGSGVGDAFFRRGSPGHSVSTHESNLNPSRYPQQLELPAPLAGQGSSPSSSTASISQLGRSTPPDNSEYRSQIPQAYEYPRYTEGYDSDEIEREAILDHQSPPIDAGAFSPPPPSHQRGAVYADHETLSSAAMRPGRSSEVYSSSTHRSGSSSPLESAYGSSQSLQQQAGGPRPNRQPSKPRGVSLVDSGPVPGSEGVRVVQRTRRTSQGPGAPSSAGPGGHRQRSSMGGSSFTQDQQAPMSPSSSSGGGGSLPPGAAPPRHSMQG